MENEPRRSPRLRRALFWIADLEDWQLALPDGKIRGGFSTKAQMEISFAASISPSDRRDPGLLRHQRN